MVGKFCFGFFVPWSYIIFLGELVVMLLQKTLMLIVVFVGMSLMNTSVSTSRSETWKVTTACFGSDNFCSQYTMTCGSGEYIVVGQLQYGTKNDRRCLFGVSDCTTEAARVCCKYEPQDELTDFSDVNRSHVISSCEGQRSCSGWAPRVATVPSSTYVRMQYACVSEIKSVDMCSANSITGTEIFLQYNYFPGFKVAILPDRANVCSCKVSSNTCSEHLTLSFVDVKLVVPQTDGSKAHCSAMTIEATNLNKTFSCSDNNVNITNVTVPSISETISLHNIPQRQQPVERLLIYITSPSRTPVKVQCFAYGQQAVTSTDPCASTSQTHIQPSTASTQTAASQTLTSSDLPDSTTSLSDLSSSSSPKVSSTTFSTEDTSALFDTKSLPEASTTQVWTSIDSISILPSSVDPTSENSVSSPLNTHSSYTSTQMSSSQNSTGIFSLSKQPVTVSRSALPSVHASPSSTLEIPTQTSAYLNNFTHQSNVPGSSTASGSRDPAGGYSTTTGMPTQSSTVSVKLVTTLLTALTEVANLSSRSVSIGTSGGNNGIVTVTESSQSTSSITTDDGGDNSNAGLIVGISVAVVLAMLLTVGILVICLWHRVKRKEAVRRNYVRNTNIFYSFPQDYEDIESTTSNSPDVDRKTLQSEVNYSLPSTLNGSTKTSTGNGLLRFDSYKIPPNSTDKEAGKSLGAPPATTTYDGFSREAENETLNYFNGTEPEPIENGARDERKHGSETKTVTFDPSALYAKVIKEGKTKF